MGIRRYGKLESNKVTNGSSYRPFSGHDKAWAVRPDYDDSAKRNGRLQYTTPAR